MYHLYQMAVLWKLGSKDIRKWSCTVCGCKIRTAVNLKLLIENKFDLFWAYQLAVYNATNVSFVSGGGSLKLGSKDNRKWSCTVCGCKNWVNIGIVNICKWYICIICIICIIIALVLFWRNMFSEYQFFGTVNFVSIY